jgi:nitrite reductase/ring-hydroxylating ferredoxin subunit
MNADGWQPLDGIDPHAGSFPARSKVDGQDVIVFQLGDGWRAVQRSCPHQQASLGDAMIVNDGRMVRCALHGYTFRLSDGKGVNCPGYKIRVYEIMRETDRLLARAVA